MGQVVENSHYLQEASQGAVQNNLHVDMVDLNMISLLASAIARHISFDHQKSCKVGTQSLDREND